LLVQPAWGRADPLGDAVVLAWNPERQSLRLQARVLADFRLGFGKRVVLDANSGGH
jgi:hypothetical protein